MPRLVIRTLFVLFIMLLTQSGWVSISVSPCAAELPSSGASREATGQESEVGQDLSSTVLRKRRPQSKANSRFDAREWDRGKSPNDVQVMGGHSFDNEIEPLTQSFSQACEFGSASTPVGQSSLGDPVFGLKMGDQSCSQSSVSTCDNDERDGARHNYFANFYADKADFENCNEDSAWHVGGLGRAFYMDDQRYQFTGNEQTFAVQGVVDGAVRHVEGDWLLTLDSQFFLNEPYDRNILANTPVLRSFQANFQVDPFQISLLTLSARNNHFLFQMGRFVTPFGRFYYPIYTNSFWDSPFIRAEAILYRETGLLLQWDPQPFIATVAITNGGLGQDTNSSKALIARIGLYGDSYSLGSSLKWQDGIGSELNKECNSHIGVDAMYRRGPWTLSGEAIIDYYGMNKPGLDPLDITWGRSIYFRDDNQTVGRPLVGYGYYVNLEHSSEKWLWNLNYGDYLPQKIGDPRQDTPIHRALIKGTRHVTSHLDVFAVTLIENSVPIFPDHTRNGFGLLVGFQYTL